MFHNFFDISSEREDVYSIESSQSLKARCFSSSGNLNGRCEENEVLNS
jgi:hypothetical protein